MRRSAPSHHSTNTRDRSLTLQAQTIEGPAWPRPMTPQAQSLIDAVGKTTACNPVSSPGYGTEKGVCNVPMDRVVPFSNPRPDQPTPREREILNYIWAGLTSQEIAARLRIAPKTVESHRANLLRKFRASNAAQLLRYALLEGLLHVPSPNDEASPPVKTRVNSASATRKLTFLK